ncbi:DNA translocase FtsK [Pseudobdellovibrio exovorus]|uniref:Cell division protein FtsK n=1 Tax=Pseudobdellovibrio exovorus JSS TaxID=1184267 RepID=M4VMG3_9BACT|nr:DNA translocase FtsK [Pseudobdellovibrio exovorus]AGH94274.1 cell division protein FtsK [Pseudobdellovibrio exovorus JSS]
MNVFFKKFKSEIRSIALFGLALFIGLALISYNPKDPSLNSMGNNGLNALNYCGILGSFLADAIYQLFGLPAWIMVAGLFHLSFLSFKGESIEWRNVRLVWVTLLICCVSALMSIYWSEAKVFDRQIFLGGLLGVGLSKGLIGVLNSVGAQILLWALTAMLIVFCFEVSVNDLVMKAMSFLHDRMEDLARSDWLKKLKATSLKPAKTAKKETKAKDKTTETILVETKNLIPEPKLKLAVEEEDDESTPSTSRSTRAAVHADSDEDAEDMDASAEAGEEDDEDVEVSAYEPPARRKVTLQAKTPRKVANWTMPKLSLLEDPPLSRIKMDEKEIRRKADITLEKLKQFDVNGQIVAAKPGPMVTMFEFKPNVDVRVNKVTDMADDLALALSAESLRIIAPIPGRDVIGIETSNAQRETVYLKDLLADETFWSDDIKLPIALGKQTNGEPKIVDLRKMPHLLIAGTTGSGKSVFTVSTITGFLFKHSPKTLRMILVDPKQVDLAAFSDIPHLIMPPIREPKKAVFALRWAVKEMEKRYKSMSKFGARNIEQFNDIVEKFNADKIAEHEKVNAEYENQGIMKLEQYYYTPQPYIVIVVEEFGDLMAVDKQNVEQNIVRLAQMARACGMHLMLAMQSPRKEVVTGLIKTNIPGRISFKVASKMDSRIILDEQGAERLLSQGDMLALVGGTSKAIRHHGPYLKETEINGVAKFWSDQGEPEFDALAMRALDGGPTQGSFAGMGADGDFGGDFAGEEEYDERYDEILAWAATQKAISASLIQRRFKLGYPRAARLIELFEREGVVGPANGSKPRAVLVASHAE